MKSNQKYVTRKDLKAFSKNLNKSIDRKINESKRLNYVPRPISNNDIVSIMNANQANNERRFEALQQEIRADHQELENNDQQLQKNLDNNSRQLQKNLESNTLRLQKQSQNNFDILNQKIDHLSTVRGLISDMFQFVKKHL